MARIKVHHHRDTYTLVADDGREFPVTFEPSEYLSIVLRDLPDGRAVVGYLSLDPEPSNPREDCDNFGHMVCWHRRYHLGDKHDHKDPDAFFRSLLGEEEYDRLDAATDYLLRRWHRAHPDIPYSDPKSLAKCDELVIRTRQAVTDRLRKRGHVWLPLYLYDHSGITMNTGGFNDRWDSGQVGYIHVAPEEILENWSVKSLDDPVPYSHDNSTKPARERAVDLLKGEVQEYDRYLTGDVYGVCVETFRKVGDDEWERVDEEACWGFSGSDYAKERLAEEVEAHVKHLTKPPTPPTTANE